MSTTIHLCPGWNLIGFPAGQPRAVPNALASIAGKYRRIFGYDPSDAADPWEIYDVAVPAWANDLKQFLPGRGYWLLATEETDLEIAAEGLQLAVSLRQPEQLAVVTGPRDVVGTVQGQDLESWELRARAVGSEEWQLLGSGTSMVTDAVLGHFDPTLRLNGLYELELAAYGAGDSGVAVSTHVVVDGFRKIGHFTLSFIDVEIPLAGVPIRVLRTYDSRDRESRDFGHGWTLDLKQGSYRNNRTPGEGWRIVTGFIPCQAAQETLPHLTTIRLSDAEVYRFRFRLTRPALTAGGCFAEAGFDFVDGRSPGATLTILGSKEVFWANGSSRAVDVASQEPYEPRAVRLRTRDGREFDLDLVEGITRLADRNGNALTLTPDGITHSAGQGIPFERDSQGRIVRIADPEGEQIEYTYDAKGDLTAVTDRETRVTRFSYDDDHFLLTVEDPRGSQAIRNEYDDSGRLIRSTDAEGKTVELIHDLDNRREVVLDRLGHRRVMEYDDRGNVVREIDPLGKVTTRTYDANDLLLTETDPLGNTFAYTYDTSRNRTASQDPLGNRTTFTHDGRGQVLTETDPRGKTTTYTYDDRGNLISETSPLGFVTTYAFDSQGNPLSETDSEGAVTRWEYDSLGRLVAQTDPLGAQVHFNYDNNGNLISESQIRSTSPGVETVVWSYSYDDIGRLTSVTAPGNSVRQAVYDVLGNLREASDPLGRMATLLYDNSGRVLEIRYPDGTTEANTYDFEGRQTTYRDRSGRITSFTYDSVGRPLTVSLPDGTTTSRSYDEAGRLVKITSATGQATTLAYDQAGRHVREQDALGHARLFTYDAAGNLAAVTDARSETTSFHYDAEGRLTQVLYPGGFEAAVQYDQVGRKIAETDAAGRTTRFRYDLAGRLVAVTDPLGKVTSYAHDEQGNLIAQTDSRGSKTRFEWDAVGRLTRRSLPGGVQETFAYDLMGNPIERTDFNGVTTRYTYSFDGRPLERLYPDGSRVSFTYSGTGMRTSATDARGTTTYEYDSRDRLERLIDPMGRELRYTYDPRGNRTSLTISANGTEKVVRYAYDAVGNRISQIRASGAGTSEILSTYDERDRLLSEGLTRYTWDANGNLMSRSGDGGAVYRWDFENRLIGVDLTDGTLVRHAYDADGNRVRTEVTPPNGPPSVTEYLIDPWHSLSASGGGRGLSQVVAEIGAEGDLQAYFIRGNDLLASVRPSGSRFYHAEALGTLRSLTDESGIVTDRYRYEAFGSLLAHEGTDPGLHLFAGEVLEPQSGLYGLRARWLSPRQGIFLSADPLAGQPSSPRSLHKYLYAGADPVGHVDPTGLFMTFAEFQGVLFTASYVGTSIAAVVVPIMYRLQGQIMMLPLYVERFLTWYDRANAALTMIDAASELGVWLDKAQRAVLSNTKSVPIPPGTDKGYGVFWEGVTDVNVGGTVRGVDHIIASEGAAVSQRSHALGYSDLEGGVTAYRKAIRADAREMVNAIRNNEKLKGIDKYGRSREFETENLKTRVLLEIIPETDLPLVRNPRFKQAMNDIASDLKVIVKVVPGRNWRGR